MQRCNNEISLSLHNCRCIRWAIICWRIFLLPCEMTWKSPIGNGDWISGSCLLFQFHFAQLVYSFSATFIRTYVRTYRTTCRFDIAKLILFYGYFWVICATMLKLKLLYLDSNMRLTLSLRTFDGHFTCSLVSPTMLSSGSFIFYRVVWKLYSCSFLSVCF